MYTITKIPGSGGAQLLSPPLTGCRRIRIENKSGEAVPVRGVTPSVRLAPGEVATFKRRGVWMWAQWVREAPKP